MSRAPIERAKQAGMHVLLDFHYSDDWADPQKQTIPAAWAADIDDADKLAAHVYEYTRDVLARLNARGLLPYMVQVGNEINTQMLRPADTKGAPIDWTRNAKILNAGIRAVREARARRRRIAESDAARGAAGERRALVRRRQRPPACATSTTSASATTRSGRRSDMKQAERALAAVEQRFKADIIVVEVSYPWTLRDAGDKASNLLGEDSLLRGYPATPSGQQRFMNDVVRMTLRAGGVGVVYWEPAWVSTSCATRWGTGSHWENATLFDFRKGNELTPAADFLWAIRGLVSIVETSMRLKSWPARHRQDRARSAHSGAAARIRASSSWPARAATPRVDGVAELSGSRSHARRGARPALHFHLHAAAGAFRRGADGAARRQARDAREAAGRDDAADRAAGRRGGASRPARCSRPGTRASPRASTPRASGCARASW